MAGLGRQGQVVLKPIVAAALLAVVSALGACAVTDGSRSTQAGNSAQVRPKPRASRVVVKRPVPRRKAVQAWRSEVPRRAPAARDEGSANTTPRVPAAVRPPVPAPSVPAPSVAPPAPIVPAQPSRAAPTPQPPAALPPAPAPRSVIPEPKTEPKSAPAAQPAAPDPAPASPPSAPAAPATPPRAVPADPLPTTPAPPPPRPDPLPAPPNRVNVTPPQQSGGGIVSAPRTMAPSGSSQSAIGAARIEEARRLLARGKVIDARAILQAAIATAPAEALHELAKTYDPFYLGQLPSIDDGSEPRRAAVLYHDAILHGSTRAGADLDRLRAMLPAPR